MTGLEQVLAEVQRRRLGGGSLREQLAWRIDALLPHGNLADAPIRDAFSEVFDAFAPPGFELVPDPDLCQIDAASGGSIVIGGNLFAGGIELGLIQRRLMLADGYAIHEVLILKSEVRGFGVSAVLLKRCFEFYDQLGFDLVILEADMTGKWHWARLGFDFLLERDLENVRNWTTRALVALGIESLRVDGYSSAAQFARMGGTRKVALADLARCLPPERPRIERIAGENGLQPEDEIAIARALMICGPKWFGRLELRGPGRVAFKAYAQAKIQPGTGG